MPDRHEEPQPSWQFFIVPGSHFDYGWCASIAECLSYGDLIIKTALDAMLDGDEDFAYTIEYAAFLRHFLTRFPDYVEPVKELLGEGRLEIGGMMVGPMEQIIGPEAFVRGILHARWWAQEALGYTPRVCQHSDCPGHALQLPQMLDSAELPYLAYSRFHAPIALHRWEAPDGSSVLAANHPVQHSYGWGLAAVRAFFDGPEDERLDRLQAVLAPLRPAEEAPEDEFPVRATCYWPAPQVLMAAENDLGLPELRATEFARLATELTEHTFRVATVGKFFEAVADAELPTYRGEAPYAFHALPACDPETYRLARRACDALFEAEALMSASDLLGLGDYPDAEMDAAWEDLFACHDHNVAGRHGEWNNEARRQGAHRAKVAGEELAREAVIGVMTNIAMREDLGTPITVFNPLAWQRTDIVETYLETVPQRDVQGVLLRDEEGNEVPVQVTRLQHVQTYDRAGDCRMHIAFIAEDLPPLGYRTFYAQFIEQPREGQTDIIADQQYLQNEHWRLQAQSGRISSLQTRRAGFQPASAREPELAPAGSEFLGEMVCVEDLRHDLEDALENQSGQPSVNFTGRSWSSAEHPARAQLTQTGPIVAEMQLRGQVLDSPFVQRWRLYRGLPRLDVITEVDWQGADDMQLRQLFPLNVPDGRVEYETLYGSVRFGQDELPGSYNSTPARWTQKWLDVSNNEWGVTLATSWGCHLIEGTTIAPLLIRTTYSCGTRAMRYRNPGRHAYRFGLVGHQGSRTAASAHRHGYELCHPPLIGRFCTARPITSIPNALDLPPSGSFLEVEGEHAVLTCLRRAHDGEGWILRLFDAAGEGGEVGLKFLWPLTGASRSNIAERIGERLKVGGNSVRLDLRPHEIATIRVSF